MRTYGVNLQSSLTNLRSKPECSKHPSTRGGFGTVTRDRLLLDRPTSTSHPNDRWHPAPPHQDRRSASPERPLSSSYLGLSALWTFTTVPTTSCRPHQPCPPTTPDGTDRTLQGALLLTSHRAPRRTCSAFGGWRRPVGIFGARHLGERSATRSPWDGCFQAYPLTVNGNELPCALSHPWRPSASVWAVSLSTTALVCRRPTTTFLARRSELAGGW